MATDSVPLKQCNRKTFCIHPESETGWLPATSEYFYKNNRAKDKLFGSCIACTSADHERWRKDSPDYFREYDEKRVTEHNEVARQRRRVKRDQMRQRERKRYVLRADQQRTQAKERRQSDHGKLVVALYRARPENRVRFRIYGSNRRARELALPNTLTSAQWQRCLEYWGYRCAVCGKLCGLWTIISADHWIAVSDKRLDNPGTVATNIIPLCHPTKDGSGGCNLSKQGKDPLSWLTKAYGKRKANEITHRIEKYFDWVREQDQ